MAAKTGGRNLGCRETQTLIHGYLDGELDLIKSLEIEQHIQECSACAQTHTSLQAVRVAIQGSSLYFQTPPGLARRIQSSVRRATQEERAPRASLASARRRGLLGLDHGRGLGVGACAARSFRR